MTDPKDSEPTIPRSAKVRKKEAAPTSGEPASAQEASSTEPAEKTGAAAAKSSTKSSGLTGAALRHLRGLGHALAPVVMVGKEGVTESLLAALRAALATHELVKVKVLAEAPLDRHDAGAQLATGTEAALAQVLGRTLLLYKRRPKKAKIELPGKARVPGAANARRTKRKARARAKGKAARSGAVHAPRGSGVDRGPRASGAERGPSRSRDTRPSEGHGDGGDRGERTTRNGRRGR